MKDIEAVHKDGSDLKKLRAERRIERNKQNAVPDASSADYERQLKKLATRGGMRKPLCTCCYMRLSCGCLRLAVSAIKCTLVSD